MTAVTQGFFTAHATRDQLARLVSPDSWARDSGVGQHGGHECLRVPMHVVYVCLLQPYTLPVSG